MFLCWLGDWAGQKRCLIIIAAEAAWGIKMKRLRIIFTVPAVIVLLAGCQLGLSADELPIDTQPLKDGMKEAVKAEVIDFFKNDDLSDTLGIDKERAEELEKSIQNYINDYELDEEAVENAKEAVYKALEEAKKLSVDELDEKIADILKNQK